MERHKGKRYLVAAAAVIVAVAIAFYYGLHDPAAGGAPQCLFYKLTGWECPGCGSQRALHAALNGDLTAAWHYNAMLFFLVPVAALYGFASLDTTASRRLRRRIEQPAALALLAAAIIAWWILRNID